MKYVKIKPNTLFSTGLIIPAMLLTTQQAVQAQKIPVILAYSFTLANNTQSASNVCSSSTDVRLQGFRLTTGNTAGTYSVSGLSFVTTGNYNTAPTATEVSDFKLYWTTSGIFSPTNLLSTISPAPAAGTQTFPAFTFTTTATSTSYRFWITMDVASSVTDGHTIAVNGIPNTSITSSPGMNSFTTSAGGTQTLYNTPSVPSTTGMTLCNANTLTLTASGAGAGQDYKWYDALTGGNLVQTGGSTYLASSSFIYYASIYNTTAGCESSPRISVSGTNLAPPVTTGAIACANQSMVLTASGAGVGQDYKWYDALAGGNLLQTGGFSFTTPVISSTTTYYVTIYNTSLLCESSPRTPVTAAIYPICEFQYLFGQQPTAVAWGYNAQQTNDGGYILSGYTLNTIPSSNYDLYIIKVASDGTQTWANNYGGTDDDGLGDSYIKQTTDGGYIVSSSRYDPATLGNDVYLVKLASDGTLSWSKTYGGTGDDLGGDIQQTSDGGYIITGSTKSFGAGDYDVYLIKTANDGTISWTKTYGGANIDIGKSVQKTTDGGYTIGGWTISFGQGNLDYYLIKTSSDGTLSWSKTYGGANSDYAYSVIQTSDGGYALAGTTASFGAGGDFYLIKTSSDGTLSWSQTYGGANGEVGYSARQTNDGGFILAGQTQSFGADVPTYNNVLLCKTASDGTLSWSKAFGGSSYDYARSVLQTSDGGYLTIGSTESFGLTRYYYLIKTDNSGNTTCGEISAAPSSGAGGIEGNPATSSGSGGVQVDDPAANSGSWGAVKNPCNITLLPVELISFTAYCNSGNIICEWSTASEENNDYFSVERSMDGLNWEEAGIVKGAGNSSSIKNYEFTDPLPNVEGWDGAWYYRLKQVDYNGQMEYFGPVSAHLLCKGENELLIYPNPSSGTFTIRSEEKISNIEVINMLGEKIYSAQINSSQDVIDLSKTMSGIYFLRTKTESKIIYKTIIISK